MGAAFICGSGNTEIQLKLSNPCSLYSAETVVISEAVNFAENSINDYHNTILRLLVTSSMRLQV